MRVAPADCLKAHYQTVCELISSKSILLVNVCVCACVCMHANVCLRVCISACVRSYLHVCVACMFVHNIMCGYEAL